MTLELPPVYSEMIVCGARANQFGEALGHFRSILPSSIADVLTTGAFKTCQRTKSTLKSVPTYLRRFPAKLSDWGCSVADVEELSELSAMEENAI